MLDPRVAPLLCAGFQGTEPTPFIRELLAAGGSVILFSRNLGDAAQVRALTDELRSCAPDGRALILVDEEGGLVQRLRGVGTRWPPAGEVGAAGSEALAEDFGRMLGAEVRALGFTVDCAPVLDVNTRADNPIIGRRAFSSDPAEAARLAGAFARGLEAAGVIPCGKHFPGHGDTALDSHVDLPRLPHDLGRLRSVELVPFRAVTVPMLMTAHVVYEGVDPELPATLSDALIGSLLRGELAYDGVVITDDLEMSAIADRWPLEEVTRRALLAGVDLLLVCHTERKQRRTLDAASRLLDGGVLGADDLARKVGRIEALRERVTPAPPLDSLARTVRAPAHEAWVQRLRDAT
ncbi:MAG: hypothetical protein AMXMBFR64_28780 [Myxococcales bacterium]